MAVWMHYNYFRDYDPALGRYIESDPIGQRGGLNTYLYAGASSLTYVDPYGLFAVGLGGGGSWTLGNGGFSISGGAIMDFNNKTVCLQSTVCARYDAFGLQWTMGMTGTGGTNSRLCSGTSYSTGVFGAGGGGIGGVGQLRQSDSSDASGGRSISQLPGKGGQAGASVGAAMGFERCKVTLICFNESPCCANPDQCGCK